MTRDEIATRTRKVIADHFCPADGGVTDDMDFIDDLRGDSLDTIEIAMALEAEFDIEVSDDDAEQIHTVGQAVDYLVKRLGVAEQVAS